MWKPLTAALALLAMGWDIASANPMLIEGERLTQAQCATCHGPQGQSGTDKFPRLAGQKAPYLLKQMKDFASGQRKSPVMKTQTNRLTDSQMRAVALYYEQQIAGHTPSDDALLSGVGRYVFERGNAFTALPACLACHGTDARGTNALPRLAGQHPGYIVAQMRSFAQRQRVNDASVMGVIANSMSELELQAVATYLGQLK
jgi:cytochrome c553